MTSYPSIQTDLKNAGAEWVDHEVVVDGNLVSSRKPDDIPAFNREMISQGKTRSCCLAIDCGGAVTGPIQALWDATSEWMGGPTPLSVCCRRAHPIACRLNSGFR